MSGAEDSPDTQKYGHQCLFRESGYKVLVWCFVKECLNEIPIKLMIVLYGFPYLIQRPYFSWPNNQEHSKKT